MDLFRIVFNPEDEDLGVYGISLVEEPANSINFIALSKDKKQIKLAAANEEKRLLVGPVLIPNQKIYRDWFDGCEIYFDADTIRLASQEFLKNGYQKNSTINHEGEFVQGVTFVESWITGKQDKAQEYGFDVPEGTWMVSMKVDSDEIWNSFVKEGTVKGFSIDSFFDIEKVNLSKVNNKKKKEDKMGKNIFAKLKALLAEEEVVAELSPIEVEDLGTLYSTDWMVGSVVYTDAEGTMPLVDAEFVWEDKTFKTDAEGKIMEPAVEEEVAETPVALSEDIQLWSWDTADGKKVFASWLGLGEVVTDDSKALMVSATFEVEGLVYTTDENGAIATIAKNMESPYWRKEEVTDVAEETPEAVEMKNVKAALKKVLKALNMEGLEEAQQIVVDRADELEDVLEEAKADADKEDVQALKDKIAELEALINTMKGEVDAVKAENVELKKIPAATKLKAESFKGRDAINGSTKSERRAQLYSLIK